jgi:hypothetical protein
VCWTCLVCLTLGMVNELTDGRRHDFLTPQTTKPLEEAGRRHDGSVRCRPIYEAASVAASSYSAYACSTRSRTRS